MTDNSFLVVPPTITRERESSADEKIVAGMAKSYTPGAWVTNGATYKTQKEAQNDSAVYRRAFAKALSVEPHKIKSRIWGMNGDTIIADRTKPGTWRFALTVDPERQPQTRNRNGKS